MTDRFYPPERLSLFRKMAAVSWDAPGDPTIYGATEIDANALVQWLNAQREAGHKISVTHAVARAMAAILGNHPDLNCTIRRGRIFRRRDVDVFLQVAIPPEDGGLQAADLSGACIRNADRLSTLEIASQLREIAARIRRRDDPLLKATKKNLGWMPPLLMRMAMKVASYVSHDLGISLKWAGIPEDPFGSILVTSVGMLGIPTAYAPLFPQAKGIGVVLVGKLYEGVKVVDGEIVIRTLLPITIALDHRLVDGFQAAVIARRAVELLENPTSLDTGLNASSFAVG